MLVINARNVNEALPVALLHLQERGVQRISRGMRVVEIPEPVATVYRYPEECVLFDAERDANPFFHFFEAMWILNGGQDVQTLAKFLPRIAEYSDNGMTFHGAYGYRLRRRFGLDQLEEVIKLLRETPDTRRAVISIYHPNLDLGTCSKDIPCNDMVMFKIRDRQLHMTVCNRSNDAIWGAYGANVVQFSFLMQYVAARVGGVDLGHYTQMSDSLHAYEDNPYWQFRKNDSGILYRDQYLYMVGVKDWRRTAWEGISHPEKLDDDLALLQFWHDNGHCVSKFHNALFSHVATPMMRAHQEYRMGFLQSALETCNLIKAEDWRIACTNWIQRRIQRRKEKA